TTRGEELNGASVFHMRKLWGIRANRQYEDGYNPQRWDDGTYSVRGASASIGVTEGTVLTWLHRGILDGKQFAKGAPWKIILSEEQISRLRECAEQARMARQRKVSSPSTQ